MITDHPFMFSDDSVHCSHPGCDAPVEEHEEAGFDFTPKTSPRVILGRYYIELIGPNPEVANVSFTGPVVATAYGLSDELLKEIEENVNTLIPDPFKVVIRK